MSDLLLRDEEIVEVLHTIFCVSGNIHTHDRKDCELTLDDIGIANHAVARKQHAKILAELKALVEHHHPTADLWTALENLIKRMEA